MCGNFLVTELEKEPYLVLANALTGSSKCVLTKLHWCWIGLQDSTIVPHCLTLGFYNGSIVQMTDKIRLTEHSLLVTSNNIAVVTKVLDCSLYMAEFGVWKFNLIWKNFSDVWPECR